MAISAKTLFHFTKDICTIKSILEIGFGQDIAEKTVGGKIRISVGLCLSCVLRISH